MAKTIARAYGYDSSKCKEVHRLGSKSSCGKASTWRTFSSTHINADGSGYFKFERNGEIIHLYRWEPE